MTMTAPDVVRRRVILLTLFALAPARAAEPPAPPQAGIALGAELDLLPTVVSAAAGEVGAGGNVWIGRDRLRLRAVGTRMTFPDGFQTPSGFQDRELTVAAGIVDLFFARDFSGPWIGAGLEYWWNTIGSPAGPDTASWSSGVATLGGGFVWKLRGNLYLNPWAAGHLLLSRPEVTLYGATWKPGALTGEVSLKVGWYTSL
jgi:hypothetical protein